MKLDVCGGCNAKIAAGDLDELLSKLKIYKRDDHILGFEKKDDATVIKITDEIAIINTVDFFPAMVDDPYIFGQIAAANAMSDIYAMGGDVISALNLVCFPENEDMEILSQILKGASDKLYEAKAQLSGGHSIHDRKIKFGLSVTGTAHPDRIWSNQGSLESDIIFVTKPLGVTLISSGYLVSEVSIEDYQRAIRSMVKLNKKASDILKKFRPSAVTDVTGFGLLGHLSEMSSDVKAQIYSSKVPVLKGAKKAARNFVLSAGAQRNRKYLKDMVDFKVRDFALEEILFDPQTSGGLLISISQDQKDSLIKAFKEESQELYEIGRFIKSDRIEVVE